MACLAPGHCGALKSAVPLLSSCPVCLLGLQGKADPALFLSWAISRAVSSHRYPASLGGPALSRHKSFSVLVVPAWRAASQGDRVGLEHGPGDWSATLMGKLLCPLSQVWRGSSPPDGHIRGSAGDVLSCHPPKQLAGFHIGEAESSSIGHICCRFTAG